MNLLNATSSVQAVIARIVATAFGKGFLFLFMLSSLIALEVLATPAPLSPLIASHATVDSRQQNFVKVTSAAWGVVANGKNQSVTRSPYLLIWSVTGGTAYNYFELRNVGSTPIHAMRVLITQVRISGSNKANEIFFERCLGGSWNSTTHTCSGTIIEVGRASQGQLSLAGLNLAINSFVDMRARTQPNSQNVFETTLDTQISRSDFRIPEVRNS